MAHSHYYRKTPLFKNHLIEVMTGQCRCGHWGPDKYNARMGGNDLAANMLGKVIPPSGLIRRYDR